jgi:hypothetical protein
VQLACWTPLYLDVQAVLRVQQPDVVVALGARELAQRHAERTPETGGACGSVPWQSMKKPQSLLRCMRSMMPQVVLLAVDVPALPVLDRLDACLLERTDAPVRGRVGHDAMRACLAALEPGRFAVAQRSTVEALLYALLLRHAARHVGLQALTGARIRIAVLGIVLLPVDVAAGGVLRGIDRAASASLSEPSRSARFQALDVRLLALSARSHDAQSAALQALLDALLLVHVTLLRIGCRPRGQRLPRLQVAMAIATARFMRFTGLSLARVGSVAGMATVPRLVESRTLRGVPG